MHCTVTFKVDRDDVRRRLWTVYHDAFTNDATRSIQEQCCYERAAFDLTLSDTDYVKIIAWKDKEVAGYILATNDLKKARVAYVNPERLRCLYPKETGQRRMWYATSFAVPPALQHTGVGKEMLMALGRFLIEQDGMLAADYSADKSPLMADTVAACLNEAGNEMGVTDQSGVAVDQLGAQVYVAFRFLKKQ